MTILDTSAARHGSARGDAGAAILGTRVLATGLLFGLLCAGLVDAAAGGGTATREAILLALEGIVIYAAVRAAPIDAKSLPRIFLPPLAVLAAIAFSTAAFVAVDPGPSLARTALLLVHVAFGLSVVRLAACLGDDKRLGLGDAFVSGVVLYVLFMVGWLGTVGKPEGIDWSAALPGFGNVRHFGYVLAAALGYAIWRTEIARREPGRGPFVLQFALQTVLWAALFWSGSRGAFMAILAAATFAIVVSPAARGLGLLASAAAAMAAGALLSLPFGIDDPMFSMINALLRTVAAETPDQFGTGRVALWRDVLTGILERPMFGHGASQIAHLPRTVASQHLSQAHNAVLEYVYSWGVAGAACLFSVLGRLWLLTQERGLHSAASGASIAFVTGANALLALSMIDGTLYHVQPLMLLALLWPLGWVASRPVPGSHPPRPSG